MAADDLPTAGVNTEAFENEAFSANQQDRNPLNLEARRRPEDEEDTDAALDQDRPARDETGGNLQFGSLRDIDLLNEPEEDKRPFGDLALGVPSEAAETPSAPPSVDAPDGGVTAGADSAIAPIPEQARESADADTPVESPAAADTGSITETVAARPSDGAEPSPVAAVAAATPRAETVAPETESADQAASPPTDGPKAPTDSDAPPPDAADPANGPPMAPTLADDSIAENAASATVGAVAAGNPNAGETFTDAVTDDADGRFAIDPATGEITVADGSLLDYEDADSHAITEEVTGSAGNTIEQSIDPSAADTNEAPTDPSLSGGAVDENAPGGAVVGTVAASDPDAGESLTYALTDDARGHVAVDPDTGHVSVADGSLIDYRNDASHNITAEVTDSAGNAYSETFTLDVAETETPVSGAEDKNDHMQGGDGSDVLDGRTFNDHLEGHGGIDNLIGGDGNDHLDGGDGQDSLDADAGDDVLRGGDGIDQLHAGAGDDALDSGSDRDRLYGGTGDDAPNGGAGDDPLYGEDGSDLFVFQEDGGSDVAQGGVGGGWTDVLALQDAAGGAPADGWTVAIESGSIVSSGDGFMELTDDAVGTVTLADGSEIAFSEIERIEW